MTANFSKLSIFLISVISSFYLVICNIPDGIGEIYIQHFNHTFPIPLTLANNSLLLIYQDGFFLYDSEFDNEKSVLKIDLNESDIENAFIKQYPLSDDGYILILLKNTLYFFDSTLTNYNEQKITYTGSIQNLILIKKENNFLYYTINSGSSNKIYIYYYKYNLDSQSNELIYSKIYDTGPSFSAANCIMMIISDSNKKVITCFYYIYTSILYSSSFDLENNLDKIDDYDLSKNETKVFAILFLETNENKSKTLLVMKDYSGDQWAIFDINNKIFSEINTFEISCGVASKEKVKFYYFPSNKEYIYLGIGHQCGFCASNFGLDFKLRTIKEYTISNWDSSDGISLFYSAKREKYSIILDYTYRYTKRIIAASLKDFYDIEYEEEEENVENEEKIETLEEY